MNENLIVELERKGVVTATFRKLNPEKKEIIYNYKFLFLQYALISSIG